jgi:hypothetical protein
MGRTPQLQLSALATKFDWPWIPRSEQVRILIHGLARICDLQEPPNPPKKEFARRPCPPRDVENLDEEIPSKGIDVFAECDPSKSLITLCLCRMRRFATRHDFQFEDVITIVLVHELAHYVTHEGKSHSCGRWDTFGESGSEDVIEDIDQQATHLYLRVARYGKLVQVFDSLSNDCPHRYKTWRSEWKKQTRLATSDNCLEQALGVFRNKLAEERKRKPPQREEIHDIIGYDK